MALDFAIDIMNEDFSASFIASQVCCRLYRLTLGDRARACLRSARCQDLPSSFVMQANLPDTHADHPVHRVSPLCPTVLLACMPIDTRIESVTSSDTRVALGASYRFRLCPQAAGNTDRQE